MPDRTDGLPDLPPLPNRSWGFALATVSVVVIAPVFAFSVLVNRNAVCLFILRSASVVPLWAVALLPVTQFLLNCFYNLSVVSLFRYLEVHIQHRRTLVTKLFT